MKPNLCTAVCGALLPVLVGCENAPTEPAAPEVASFNFLNGPSDLINVIRFEDQVAFNVRDSETDLLAVAGLPADPTDAFFCGGPSGFQLMALQFVGQLQEVFHALVIGDDVNLHVYQLSTFTGPCTATPSAVGRGSLRLTDNDVFVSLTRTNSFGGRMVGTVEHLASGERLHLTAVGRMQIKRDGTFRQLVTKVHLR